MARIQILEQSTIDMIAAGEVVERPSSVVKELTENSVDAGADAITVQIRGGGMSLIRVTDNGEGIEQSQILKAFLPHATSKIRSADDLMSISSFGFRGEALPSIAAVSRVELITKTRSSLTGTLCKLEGGMHPLLEEIGAPDGSTFLICDLFYNTPARHKFLKSERTEEGYISQFIERLAISRPDISLKYVADGNVKLSTSGSGDQKNVLYTIFGRQIASSLIQIDKWDENGTMRLSGWLGKPQISRGNRMNEILFVNGRLISSYILSKALEEGYDTFLMQHCFPFAVLSLTMDGSQVDVNVHPSKSQVRFMDNALVSDFVRKTVREALTRRELIIRATFDSRKEEKSQRKEGLLRRRDEIARYIVPEPFEKLRREHQRNNSEGEIKGTGQDDSPYSRQYSNDINVKQLLYSLKSSRDSEPPSYSESSRDSDSFRDSESPLGLEYLQSLESPLGFLTEEHRKSHKMIGQIFGTYWIIEFNNSMYIVDQHAAHEKVLFERLMKKYKNKKVTSQMVNPSIIVSLTMAEENMLVNNIEMFREIGFDINAFGDHDYAISAIPQDLYGLTGKGFFLEMLGSLSESSTKIPVEDMTARIAHMACKAAVKGNTAISIEEANELIDELLMLDNPYNCPHGRPVIISLSRDEIDKKFHRIV